jgi:cellulose synthase/poly-beta-1,6-N-acetylglucosamine synthase-like glycosyltransferase
MSQTRFSVIVPAYNAERTISACVTALRAQAFDHPYEIIVVDDGSTDDTATAARAAGARVITIPNSRPAAARNVGIRAAAGEIICCTDADCVPHVEWLQHITAPFTDAEIAACKGSYATKQTELVARFVQIEYEDKYDLLRSATYIDFIDTYSAAYRRDILLACGGFDEWFDYLEDQELSFRLAALGYKMVYQPAAVVDHLHSATLQAYLRKKQIIGYWKAQVVRRFPHRAVKDSHTPQVMKVQMLLSVLLAGLALLGLAGAVFAPPGWVITGWLFFLPAIAVALVFVATTLPFIRKAWRKDRGVALASPALLLGRALALSAGYVRGVLAPRRLTG